jgi:hypothetical protein
MTDTLIIPSGNQLDRINQLERLIALYAKHVVDMEGTDFLENRTLFDGTDEDWAELQRLAAVEIAE